ncbi:MAG: hypothetical protein IT436_15935 [Phycisphaerales bacterium]|nr:hypothetical protein [Phycisphaerales bacterium]
MLVDRAVHAAASLDDQSRDGVSAELLEAVSMLSPEQRELLRDRRPEAMIPLLKLAGEYLAPLQLVGEVPCVRVYRADLSGSLAASLYRTDLNRHVAPEALLTPGAIGPDGPEVRYLDVLLDQEDRRWPPRSLVLISNARVEPEGYMDMGTKAVSRLAELLVRLPGVDRDRIDQAVEVPASHPDWGLALLMRASLGQRCR